LESANIGSPPGPPFIRAALALRRGTARIGGRVRFAFQNTLVAAVALGGAVSALVAAVAPGVAVRWPAPLLAPVPALIVAAGPRPLSVGTASAVALTLVVPG